MIDFYMDNCGNSRANTRTKARLLEGLYLLDSEPTPSGSSVNHNKQTDAGFPAYVIQISAPSAFDGRIEAYHGVYG